MNERPHAHGPEIRSRRNGWNVMLIVYGDTKVALYPWPLRHIGPYRRKITEASVRRATERAIARHDAGSKKEGLRQQRLDEANAVLKTVQSDWWMNSAERMDKLHLEALRLNEDRDYAARSRSLHLPRPSVFLDAGV
jgi:hypothetical protein